MDGSKDSQAPAIRAAEMVLPAPDLAAAIGFFREKLGFRLDMIFPADNPAEAALSGHGLRLRLKRDAKGDPGELTLLVDDAAARAPLTAPNGTVITFAPADPPMVVPPVRQRFSVQKMGTDAPWITGRAGMEYRDLIPDREGGRFIASHIRIPQGGPVPDNVHFHKIRFQMIYCYKGWVRLVYEDQGAPFIMKAGDCVLQPPQIRHRVLESGDGLEVIEIGCPAEHLTLLDHEMDLPTGRTDPDKDFGGQRFVFHQVAKADWAPWRLPGFEARDLGIAAATDRLAGVKVARRTDGAAADAPAFSHAFSPAFSHGGEFLFLFVLAGGVRLDADGHDPAGLEAGDCVTVPAGLSHTLNEPSADLELLEVSLPALG